MQSFITEYRTYTDYIKVLCMEHEAQAWRCQCCQCDGPRAREDGCDIGSGLCAYCYACSIAEDCKSIPDEDKDVVPDVSVLSFGEGGSSTPVKSKVPGCSGLYRRPRDAQIGRLAPACVSEDERPPKRQRSQLLGSGQFGGTDFSWQLPVMQEPQISTTILHEGRELHIEHGSDGGEEGDLEASEGTCSGGEDTGSDGSSGDEGELFDPVQESHYQAVWDTWRQTVFDTQQWSDPDAVIDSFYF